MFNIFKKIFNSLRIRNKYKSNDSHTSEELEKYFNSKSWKTSVAKIGGERPSLKLGKSRIAGSFLMKKNEQWPKWEKGYLDSVLQINLDELPFVPQKIKRFKMINIFIDLNHFLDDPELENSCQIRAYESLDDLELRESPNKSELKTFEIKWQLAKDNPSRETSIWEIGGPEEYVRNKEEFNKVDFSKKNHELTKVGGWPSIIQHELEMSYEDFVIQIGSEDKAKLNWVDGGNMYIGYNGKEWLFECQFY